MDYENEEKDHKGENDTAQPLTGSGGPEPKPAGSAADNNRETAAGNQADSSYRNVFYHDDITSDQDNLQKDHNDNYRGNNGNSEDRYQDQTGYSGHSEERYQNQAGYSGNSEERYQNPNGYNGSPNNGYSPNGSYNDHYDNSGNGSYSPNGSNNQNGPYNANGPYGNQGYPNGFYGNNYQQTPPNGMATAAMILGILSLAASCCLYIAIPLGVIGIILASLSKGSDRELTPRAKAGLGLSIGGAALSLFLTIASFAATIGRYGFDGISDMLKEYEQFYENQIGGSGQQEDYDSVEDWLEDYMKEKDAHDQYHNERRGQDNVI